jgi:hypothetical protein
VSNVRVLYSNTVTVYESKTKHFYFKFRLVLNVVSFSWLTDGLLASSQYPEGPATGHLDTRFLVFPVSKSECSDGSQHSKLLLHASNVALAT